MRSTKLSAVVLAGLLSVSLAACGSNDVGTGASAAAPTSAAAPSTADTAPVADIKNLTGVKTEVTLDKGFLAGLTSLKVTPSPLGTATISSAGVASFPITGGNITVYNKGAVDPYIQGMIMHEGSGLQLVAGGKTVKLENFVVDPGESVLTGKVTVDGKVAFESAPLFFLDGSTLMPIRTEGSNAIVEGTTVSLTKAAADALNGVFGTTALTEFFKVGVAKITVATK